MNKPSEKLLLSACLLLLTQRASPCAENAHAPTAKALHAQAVKAFAAGDIDSAQSAEKKALARDPKSWSAHAGMACIFSAQHKMDKAMREAQEAVSLDEKNPRALLVLAKIEQEMYLYSQAMEHYREALAVEPGFNDARVGLAQCLAMLGHRNDALKELDELQRATPSDFETNLRVGEVLVRLGQYAKARGLLQRAVTVAAPDDQIELATSLLLIAAAKSGDDALAQKLFATVSAKLPPDKQACLTCLDLIPNTVPITAQELLAATPLELKKSTEFCVEFSQRCRAKAASVDNADVRKEWLELALFADAQARAAAGVSVQLLFERAAVLDELRRYQEAAQELERARSLQRSERLSSELARTLHTQLGDITLAAKRKLHGGAQNSSPDGKERPYTLPFYVCEFELQKPSCVCRAKSLQYQLKIAPSVLMVSLCQIAPVRGVFIYDHRAEGADKILSKLCKSDDHCHQNKDYRALTVADITDARELGDALAAESVIPACTEAPLQIPQ
jgi:tetratricopeptide (TPR) repeat protein